MAFAVDGYEDEPIRAVGTFVDPQKGARLELEGEWVSHPKHGHQFKVSRFISLNQRQLKSRLSFWAPD